MMTASAEVIALTASGLAFGFGSSQIFQSSDGRRVSERQCWFPSDDAAVRQAGEKRGALKSNQHRPPPNG